MILLLCVGSFSKWIYVLLNYVVLEVEILQSDTTALRKSREKSSRLDRAMTYSTTGHKISGLQKGRMMNHIRVADLHKQEILIFGRLEFDSKWHESLLNA